MNVGLRQGHSAPFPDSPELKLKHVMICHREPFGEQCAAGVRLCRFIEQFQTLASVAVETNPLQNLQNLGWQNRQVQLVHAQAKFSTALKLFLKKNFKNVNSTPC